MILKNFWHLFLLAMSVFFSTNLAAMDEARKFLREKGSNVPTIIQLKPLLYSQELNRDEVALLSEINKQLEDQYNYLLKEYYDSPTRIEALKAYLVKAEEAKEQPGYDAEYMLPICQGLEESLAQALNLPNILSQVNSDKAFLSTFLRGVRGLDESGQDRLNKLKNRK